MTLRAGQIYPPTAVGFTIAAFDYNLEQQPAAWLGNNRGVWESPTSVIGWRDADRICLDD